MEYYEVEAFLRSRRKSGRLQYLVKWVGYSPAQNRWCYAAKLSKDLDADFFKKLMDGMEANY